MFAIGLIESMKIARENEKERETIQYENPKSKKKNRNGRKLNTTAIQFQ